MNIVDALVFVGVPASEWRTDDDCNQGNKLAKI